MAEISTNVLEKSFDEVIAEFDKPEDKTDNSDPFIPKDKSESKVFDGPGKTTTAQTTKAPEEKTPPQEATPAKPPVVEAKKDQVKDLDSVLDRKDPLDEEDAKEDDKKDISSLSSMLEDLTKEQILFPFDEEKSLKDYSLEDIKELIKTNIEHQKKEALDSEIEGFFESLPTEIQYAAKYVADGGTDLKALFKALAATEEIKSLDVKKLVDRESIIKEYYKIIDWGTDKEINDEIERIKELGDSEVEKLAGKFKPKIEKMHDEIVQQQLARQEGARKLQEKEMEVYLSNAQDAIKAGKIDEIQLDKKMQSSLWAGLTQPSYQTRRGLTTNELGHLLEKYQYTEPNFKLMYKVLWLLKDEKGFEEAVSKKKVNENVNNTVRTLKTDQSKKSPTTVNEDTNEDATKTAKKVVKRNSPPSFLSGLKK